MGEAGNESSSAALPAVASDFGSRSSAGFAGSLPVDSPDNAEGGYVDIGSPSAASGLLNPAQQTPTSSPDAGGVGDPATGGEPVGDAPHDGIGVARDDAKPTAAHDDEVVPLDVAEQDSTHAPLNSAEGGMVELAAAAPQDALPVSTKSPQPGETLRNMKEIELDNGLGLFHAFELATTPLQLGNRAGDGSEKTNESGMPSEANTLPMPPAHSAVKPVKSENSDLGEEVGLRPAALSSVLLVAMFVPAAGVRRGRRGQASGDGYETAAKGEDARNSLG